MKKTSQIAVGVDESRISTIFLEYTSGAIQDRVDISPSFLPFGKAGGLQIRRYQGLAVAHYGFTLGALALKPSGFCNIGVYLEAEQMIVKGQLRSIAVSVAIVFLIVSLIMRSLAYGALAIMPLCVSICVNFGIMGLLDIPLDAATAIAACVAIGIGIDYGLHYINRYRIERTAGNNHREAILLTGRTTGGSICINALAVSAGFSVLLLSAFVPFIHLGLLIALTMLTSSACALTMIPAVLSLAHRSDPGSIPTKRKE